MAARDHAGRFLPGGPGGPGRPQKAIEEKYRKALASAVTARDITEIGRVMVEKAKAGDVAAVKVLFEWLVPKPIADLNVTGGLMFAKGYVNVSPDDWSPDDWPDNGTARLQVP